MPGAGGCGASGTDPAEKGVSADRGQEYSAGECVSGESGAGDNEERPGIPWAWDSDCKGYCFEI